jgi:hypothetical protein
MSTKKQREEEEEVDVVLLIVRYAFQIARLVIYVQKTRQKVKERNAIGEISIEDGLGEIADTEIDSESGDSRRRSSSGVDDHVRRKTDIIF